MIDIRVEWDSLFHAFPDKRDHETPFSFLVALVAILANSDVYRNAARQALLSLIQKAIRSVSSSVGSLFDSTFQRLF